MQRFIVSAQLAPHVAFAVRLMATGAWLIVTNPGLSRADRDYTEALAEHLVDSIESGWSCQPPAGGVDVMIGVEMMTVTRVVDADTYDVVRMVGNG